MFIFLYYLLLFFFVFFFFFYFVCFLFVFFLGWCGGGGVGGSGGLGGGCVSVLPVSHSLPHSSPEFIQSLSASGRRRGYRRGNRLLQSDLGLEHLQEQFVHGHLALHLDAVEVLHGLGGRLAEEGEGHEQLSCPPRVLLVLGRLIVLQGLVESVLELLNSLHVLYVHGVCQGQREGGRGRVSLDRRLGSFLLSDKQNDTRDSKKYKACEWHGVNFQENAVIYCES